MAAMKHIISINRSGKYADPQASGGSLIPAEPNADGYSGKVIFVAAPDDSLAEYAVISLQDYMSSSWSAPVYAILYTFVRTIAGSEWNTDEYRVDYVGRVTGVSDEFTTGAGKLVRTVSFVGLWKAGQGGVDSWLLYGTNGGQYRTMNLEYGDIGTILSETKFSSFRPANDIILSDDARAQAIVGSDYTSSKWELKNPISDKASRAIDVMKWSGVKADGSTVLLGEYPVARFGLGMVSASMERLNVERYVMQIIEQSVTNATQVGIFSFASPVAIAPDTLDLYWLGFLVGGGMASLMPAFAKTGECPTDVIPYVENVCGLTICNYTQPN